MGWAGNRPVEALKPGATPSLERYRPARVEAMAAAACAVTVAHVLFHVVTGC